MDLWNADKLTLFIIFFLPGFISMKVYDLLVPGETRDVSKSVFEAIAYSTLNFAALLWLIILVNTDGFYQEHRVLYFLSLVFIMIIVPIGWPLAFLRLSSWRPLARHFVHPIRKPWDYVFGKREPYWIIVHLRDGRKVGGTYGTGSFASSSPAEEQIYLEEVWALDNEGRFLRPVDRSCGIIIMTDQILAVEFFRVE